MKNLICISLVIICAVSPVRLMSLTPDELVSEGDRNMKAFKNVEATNEYGKAYSLRPDDYEILMKLTIACNNAGEDSLDKGCAEKYFSKAVELAEELVRRHPQRASSHFLLAACLGNLVEYRGTFEKGNLAKRIHEEGSRCIEIDPGFSPGYVVLGIYYRQMASLSWLERKTASAIGGLPEGTFEKSRQMLEKAVEKSPEEIYPHYQLALTLQMMGETREAAKVYRKILLLQISDHQDGAKQAEAAKQLKELKL